MKVSHDIFEDRSELRCEGHLVTVKPAVALPGHFVVTTGRWSRNAEYAGPEAYEVAIRRLRKLVAEARRLADTSCDHLLFSMEVL